MSGDTLLMIGGSGAMGSHVIRQLLKSKHNFKTIRLLTRNPSGSECQALAATDADRIELISGNVNNVDSLKKAINGSDVIFLNTNFWSCLQDVWVGTNSSASDPWPFYQMAEDMDVDQSKQILELARKAKVRHVILSSLDDATGLSGGKFPAPHFDAKARVDHFVDKQRDIQWYAESVTSLITAPYMENFVAGRMFRGGNENAAVRLVDENGKKRLMLRVPLDAAAWPMVTLDDIGRFTTMVLNDGKTWKGKNLKIVSESLSMEKIAEIFERVTGIKATYDPFSLTEYRALPLPERPALSGMFGLITEFGLDRDMTMLRKLNPVMDTFEGWLKASNWKGEVGKVQKDNAQPIK